MSSGFRSSNHVPFDFRLAVVNLQCVIVHSRTGQLQLPNLPAASGWAEAFKDGFAQQCAVPVPNLNTNPNVEVANGKTYNVYPDRTRRARSLEREAVSDRITRLYRDGLGVTGGAARTMFFTAGTVVRYA
jgi:hypothetical protein